MRQKRDGMVGVTFEREYKLGIRVGLPC